MRSNLADKIRLQHILDAIPELKERITEILKSLD